MECSQVFLNIFRVLLLKGLTRMLWTQLNSGYFTFLGTCTYDRADDKGRPLPDGAATYVREDLADRIHNLTSNMRMWGAHFLLLAIVTQVPWVFALVYFVRGFIHDTLAGDASA